MVVDWRSLNTCTSPDGSSTPCLHSTLPPCRGPIVWVLGSEVQTLDMRASGMSVVVFVNYLLSFVIGGQTDLSGRGWGSCRGLGLRCCVLFCTGGVCLPTTCSAL